MSYLDRNRDDESVNSSSKQSKSRLDSLPPYIISKEKKNSENLLNEYFKAKESSNFDFIANITSNSEFGNPSLLKNIAEYFQIDEIGSNYAKDVFDPHFTNSSSATSSAAYASTSTSATASTGNNHTKVIEKYDRIR